MSKLLHPHRVCNLPEHERPYGIADVARGVLSTPECIPFKGEGSDKGRGMLRLRSKREIEAFYAFDIIPHDELA